MKKYKTIVNLTLLYVVCFYVGNVRCKENSTADSSTDVNTDVTTHVATSSTFDNSSRTLSPFQLSKNASKKASPMKKRMPTLRRRFLPYRFKNRRYYDWHNYIGAQNAYDGPRYQHLPPQPPFPPAPAPPPVYPNDPYAYPGAYANPQDPSYYEGDRRHSLRNPGFDNSYARRPLPIARRFKLRRPIRPTEPVPQLNYLEKVSKPGGGFEYRQVKLHHDDQGNVYYSRRGETTNGTIVVKRERNYYRPRQYPYYPEPQQEPHYQPDTYYSQPGYSRPGYYPQEAQVPNPYPQPYPQPPYPQPQAGYSFQQQPYPPQPYPPQPYPPPPYPPQQPPPPQPQPYPQTHGYPPQSYGRPPVHFPLGGYVKPDIAESRGTAIKFSQMRAEQRFVSIKPAVNHVGSLSTVRSL